MLEKLLPDNLAKRIKVDAVVDPSLDYTQSPNDIIPVFDGVSGELMREIPNFGLRVSRRKLRALCGEGVDVLVSLNSDGRTSMVLVVASLKITKPPVATS